MGRRRTTAVPKQPGVWSTARPLRPRGHTESLADTSPRPASARLNGSRRDSNSRPLPSERHSLSTRGRIDRSPDRTGFYFYATVSNCPRAEIRSFPFEGYRAHFLGKTNEEMMMADRNGALIRRTIRRQRLREMVPLADSTIYEMEQRGEFPRRFARSPRCVVWDLAEVETWLASRRSMPIARAQSPDVRQRRSRPVR
jgi:prophage regulatory protein